MNVGFTLTLSALIPLNYGTPLLAYVYIYGKNVFHPAALQILLFQV